MSSFYMLCIVLLSFLLTEKANAQIPDELAQVTLSSDFETVSPGASGWLITKVKVESGWHMYWKNAGQSGYPTTIEWEADGVELGALQFPAPKAYEFLEMIIYVHEGEVVLLTEMKVDEDFDSGN